IFTGIRKARDQYHEGVISFGKAFLTGWYIALVASLLYLAAWLIEYHVFMPDFMEKYIDHMRYEAVAGGATAEEADQEVAPIVQMEPLYRNWFFIFKVIVEILPGASVIALLSSWILKRRPGMSQVEAAG